VTNPTTVGGEELFLREGREGGREGGGVGDFSVAGGEADVSNSTSVGGEPL